MNILLCLRQLLLQGKLGVGAKELKAAGTAWSGGSSDWHKAALSAGVGLGKWWGGGRERVILIVNIKGLDFQIYLECI